MMIALILAQASPDALSGGAGWVGAGLLGAVLAWLLLKHLPDKDRQVTSFIEMKDKQITAILAANDLERERERTDRHDRASVFQKALNDTAVFYGEQMRALQTEHKLDAEKDRASFMQRSADVAMTLKMAIEKQTLELERAIKSSCRFQGNDPSRPIKENM